MVPAITKNTTKKDKDPVRVRLNSRRRLYRNVSLKPRRRCREAGLSRDGHAHKRFRIWILFLEAERKPREFVETGSEGAARFSPDGYWIDYASNESGRLRIVRPALFRAGWEVADFDRRRKLAIGGAQGPGAFLFEREQDEHCSCSGRVRTGVALASARLICSASEPIRVSEVFVQERN